MIEMYLKGIDWAYEFSSVFNVEDCWNIFLSHLTTAIQIYVPIKKRSLNQDLVELNDIPRKSGSFSTVKLECRKDGE